MCIRDSPSSARSRPAVLRYETPANASRRAAARRATESTRRTPRQSALPTKPLVRNLPRLLG
eukprot:10822501-Alexandrium_andersonii.AAC.1